MLYEFVRLLHQSQGKNGVWKNSGQIRQETFVHGKEALSLDGLQKTVENALVQIAILVVES